MQGESVRLGVVGLGFMGQTHATNAFELGHEVVAGADIVPDIRENFETKFGARTYEEFETMYENEDLDAVAVSTPNAFHEDAVVAALGQGYDVLCEKPLADSLEAAERMAETAREADGFCMVNFHNRVSTAAELFKGYQDAGHFGDVRHIRANYIRSRGIPGVGSWFTNEELSGGGVVVDIGVHAIDFALYLMDFPPVETVFGVTRNQFGNRDDYVDPDDWYDATEEAVFDVEDSATALIRCADGRTISLEVAWATNEAESQEFVVRGSEAGARLELGGDDLTMLEARSSGPDHLVESTVSDASIDHVGWEGSDKRFLDAVVAGQAPEFNTIEQALTTQRVMDAIYRSSESGGCVEVGEKR
ncbi:MULTISPECIES: Gfo/Idh/MocA family oxidoreductase [unclassified Haladaptatus]|uniref:Gfo/Idh/MocA family protein n=1 Tax=unclassified Haladaptatus TaxID=2622732 RepID=UPI00209BE9AF|nr:MULTISPECIES: Gfo/Idh/MocA family oxidoreductase [unclassified Haladaptatus]MCO8246533.1 Gfo/Idh/MocA family oxidoreductase [Haladaptatus sp. AB643]MCO8254771.1 Gfo/Idh/MocA family oxidoreductase [Haladaptatus sp. AB618]